LIVVLTFHMRDQQHLVFPGYCPLLARMIQNLFNSEKTFNQCYQGMVSEP
jgi:hypothetical protein